MKTKRMLVAITVSMLSSLIAFGEECIGGNLKQAKIDADMESALDTVAYINQMNYAFMVMETYHNVLAVQEEYEKISLERIDVTRIPAFSHDNKAMLTLIKEMLDSLKALKMSEDDYKHYQEVIEDNRRRAKKDMWFKIIASAPRALSDAGQIVTKSSGNGDAYTVSAQAIIAMAGDLIGGPVMAAMDYNKTLDELRARMRDSKFTYEREKEKEVHKASKSLLDAEFEFVKAKNLKREDIVTPEEQKSLVAALKNGKADRVFKLLNTQEMRTHYRRFAPYWYYLASFAVKCKNYKVALEAADGFFREYRGLIKVDPMVAQTAIVGVTALIATETADKEKVREWIGKIRDVNYNNANSDYSYFCADVLYHVLNEPQEALKILDTANAKIEGDFEDKLLTYRNKYSEGEVTIAENDIPKDIDLLRIRSLYNDILSNNDRRADLLKNIADICANQTVSSVEKLFYIGQVRVTDLWKEAKKDVLAIKMRYVNHWWANRFKIEIPVSWFLLGEVNSKVILSKGTNEVEILNESIGERKIRQNKAGVGSDIVTLTFFCPQKKMRCIDSVKFVFEHKSWPVEIIYKPSLAFNVQEGEDDRNDISEYVPVKIKFMKEEMDLLGPPENVKDTILCDKRKKHSAFLMPFQFGNTAYNTNFLSSMSIDNDRVFEVAYTNPTPSNTSVDLVINYYSRYGARLCSVESSNKIKAGTGGMWKLPWPSDMLGSELPAYVLFQYHIDNEVWERWVREQDAKINSVQSEIKLESK